VELKGSIIFGAAKKLTYLLGLVLNIVYVWNLYMAKFKKILLFLLISVSIFGQNTVRVMSYNLHNYPNSQDANFKKIISTINPDALIVVEMLQSSGVSSFLQNSLNSGYASASFVGNYNDCAFYYKTSVFTLLSSKDIYATTRDISEFKLKVNSTGDTLIVFGVHLKANDRTSADLTTNPQKRASAAQSLRNETKTFPARTNYLVCGDFNIFSSTEQAFQNMVDKSLGGGYFVDMMNAIGNWSGNSAFNNVCSYSSTSLDTRLDMVLVSQAIMDAGGIEYKEFKIFGNDLNHFGTSVASGANAWFSGDATLGSAMTSASDHLPVYVDLKIGMPTGNEKVKEIPKYFELSQNYPNPFNPSTNISFTVPYAETQDRASLQHVLLKVYDITGREIATLVNEEKSPGKYSVKFDAGNLTSGIYFYRLQSGTTQFIRKMIVLK